MTVRRSFAVIPFSAALAAFAADAVAQSPTVSGTVPAAVVPGGTVDVKVRGGNLAGATSLWTSFPAKVELAPLPKNGENAGEVTFRVTVPAEAGAGVHGFRVVSPKGISSLRPIVVDELPSVERAAGNGTPETAQTLPMPCAVDGAMEALGRHYFRFPVAAGQRVAVETLARRFGSALDPMIRLLDPRGREVAWSDDSPGLSGDSQLTWVAQVAGDHLLELRDIRYQGGATHHYRLRIGDFPAVATAYPLGVQRGTKAAISFAGPDVETVAPVAVQAPTDPQIAWLAVGGKRAGGKASGFALVSVGDRPEYVEQEPNDAVATANPLPAGANANGRFEKAGDVDCFRFAAKKGIPLTLTAVTRTVGSPVDLVLRVLDSGGKQLAQADDVGPSDAVVSFSPAEDGNYVLEARDLQGRGGSAFAYRVAIAEPQADFTLSLVEEAVNVPAGGSAALTVNVGRGAYKGPIAITVADPPQGFTASRAVVPDGGAIARLTIEAADDAAVGKPFPLRLVGTANVGGKSVTATADIAAALKAGWNAMRVPPPQLISASAAAVAPATAVRLKVASNEVALVPGLSTTVKVSAIKTEGFDDVITLVAPDAKAGLPANVTIAVKPIAKGQAEAEVVVTATDKAALGEATIVLAGTAKVGAATVTAVVPALTLRVAPAFQLTADLGSGKIAKDGTLTLTAKAVRSPAFAGPIAVTVAGLPKEITAAAAEIPADKETIEVVLTAKNAATAGPLKNVKLAGSGTAGKVKVAAESAELPLIVE